MIQAVRNGSVDALILDEPFLRYASLLACDVKVVGSLFLPTDYVMGINPNLDPVRARDGCGWYPVPHFVSCVHLC